MGPSKLIPKYFQGIWGIRCLETYMYVDRSYYLNCFEAFLYKGKASEMTFH